MLNKKLNKEIIKKLEVIADDLVLNDDIKLEKDEFLLKIRGIEDNGTPTGFFVQLNKNGTVPKAFKDWGSYGSNYDNILNLDTFLVKAEFCSGWKLKDVSHGMSTTWIIVEHPFGFELEVAGRNLTKLLMNLTIVKGVIQEECMFEPSNKNLIIKN
jgi:hypothetical protein